MKRWIAGILCVSCLLMMTACSRNGEEVSGSREESSQTMESSSESVEQPSEDSQPEETAEPEEPVSSQPRTVSIRPVTSAEAEPVQVNVTARNAIAAEMVVVSDGQKAAEFAAELQSLDCGCPSVGGRVHPGYGRRNHRGEFRGKQFLYIQQPDTGWSRTDEA